jgi:MraZ protein
MAGLLGEFVVSLDDKGRLRLPAALKGQIAPAVNGRFVINRGFEKCLTMYPYDEWEQVSAKVNKLNTFVKRNREFARTFFRGATEVTLDGADRILLPKLLADYAGVGKEVLLTARNNVIEIWNKDTYDALMDMDSDAYADLAEDVMGDQKPDQE